jgi:hypothetical protein
MGRQRLSGYNSAGNSFARQVLVHWGIAMSEEVQPPQPRLGIVHLLLWMTGVIEIQDQRKLEGVVLPVEKLAPRPALSVVALWVYRESTLVASTGSGYNRPFAFGPRDEKRIES